MDNEEEKKPKDMRTCVFGAQDIFQTMKRKAAKFTDCINDVHKLELSLEQSKAVLEAGACASGIETYLAEKHVELQGYFVALDAVLAEESLRRR